MNKQFVVCSALLLISTSVFWLLSSYGGGSAKLNYGLRVGSPPAAYFEIPLELKASESKKIQLIKPNLKVLPGKPIRVSGRGAGMVKVLSFGLSRRAKDGTPRWKNSLTQIKVLPEPDDKFSYTFDVRSPMTRGTCYLDLYLDDKLFTIVEFRVD